MLQVSTRHSYTILFIDFLTFFFIGCVFFSLTKITLKLLPVASHIYLAILVSYSK